MKTVKWKTLNSKLAFESKYIKIREEDFLGPSGKEYKYHLIERRNYVMVLARDKDHFYLTKQDRYTIKCRLLQVVAGAMEKGESELEAVKKELQEEAGITAKKFTKLGWTHAYYGASAQRAHVYLAEDLEIGEQKPEDLEKEGNLKLAKVKISKVREFIRTKK